MTSDEEPGLASIELLSSLDEETLQRLDQGARWFKYAGNEVILDRSSESRDVYFVVSGVVRIVNYSTTGREISFANVRAGGFFGEISAIDGEARSATVIAVEPCRLASLSPDSFRRLLRENPELAEQVMVRLTGIVRKCDDRIMDLSTLRAVHRVYAELLRLCEADIVSPKTSVIRPMRTHSDIASRISTTRETVARVMSQLASAGIVERKAKTLYIRDMDRLTKLARSGAELDETG